MSFELDDWVHFQFNFDPYRKGGAPPSVGAGDLAGGVRLDGRSTSTEACSTVCMHPQVIGRGHRIAMLERFIEHCLAAGAGFKALGDVAQIL